MTADALLFLTVVLPPLLVAALLVVWGIYRLDHPKRVDNPPPHDVH